MKNDHHFIAGWQDRFALLAWAVSAILFTACVPDATVVISPVFPADEPDLLGAVGVGNIVVDLTPQGSEAAAQTYTLTIGEKLRLTDVPPGIWTVSLSGRTHDNERVFGRSLPFEIKNGVGARVPVFIGRSNSFNRVKLTPDAVANRLVGLTGHASVQVQSGPDESRILVAGGKRPNDEEAATRILLIDPATLTVEEFPTPMSCPRRQPHATVIHHPVHGDVVALSGGEGCQNRLDLFFAREAKLVSHALDCDITNSAGAYAEVEQAGRWPGASAWPHTGRLIFPGSPSCIVTLDLEDLGFSSQESRHPNLVGSALTLLGNGRLATVDKDGVLTISDASTADDSTVMPAFDLWEPNPSIPRLMSTGTGTELVYLRSTELGETLWSLVRLSGRSIGAVIDGDPLSTKNLPKSPVAIDVSSSETTMILFAGGMDRDHNRTRATSLFYVPGVDGIPTWHKLQDEAHGTARPTLRTPRAGHTVTSLSNRSSWVIGGGATAAEIFVHGSEPVVAGGSKAVEPLMRVQDHPFVHRKPTITSLTVHDPLDQNLFNTDSLGTNVFTSAYRSVLRKADASAVLDLWASAGRGVGDGLVERHVPGSQGCLSMKVDFEMPPRGEVFGDLDGISVDGRWTTFPGGGVSQSNYLRSLTLDTSAAQHAAQNTTSTGSSPEETQPPPEQRLFPPPRGRNDTDFENTNDGPVLGSGNQCTWRQFVRVGFDGLSRSETDRTYSGVHVLVWLARGDDCSQGVIASDSHYPDNDDGNTCVDSMYDDYFGLPPQVESQKEQLRDMVHDISFDPRDFVVVLVQLPAHSQLQVGPATLQRGVNSAASGLWKAATGEDAVTLASEEPPVPSAAKGLRRLYDTSKALENMRVRVVEGFVDDSGSLDSLEVATDKVVAQVESQLRELDPLQSCIPASVLRSDPPSILFAEHLGPDGLYLPLHVVSDLSDDMAKNVLDLESTYAEDVQRACRIQSLQRVDDPNLDVPRYRVESLSGESTDQWKIATDSDRNGGCDSGFLVRLANDSTSDNSPERILRCEL